MCQATIDMNVIRASLCPERVGYAAASKLLHAAACGEIRLAVPPQGALADLHGHYDGDLARDIKALLAKPGVVELPQVARSSEVTFPGENLVPGNFLENFDAAWNAIVADWKTHQGACPGAEDRWHVESHLLSDSDVLVTDDRALRAMCGRLRDEHRLDVVAESLTDFAARLPRAGLDTSAN